MQFDCTACKHHQPNDAFMRIAELSRMLREPSHERRALRHADKHARCQLSGEYCGLERTGGKLGALLTGRCGKAARFMEPK